MCRGKQTYGPGYLLVHIDGAWINSHEPVVSLFVLPVGLLRWVWWRQNLYAEIIGFIASFPLAPGMVRRTALGGVEMAALAALPVLKDHPYWQAFAVLFGVGLLVQVLVTLLTPPERRETLVQFFKHVQPPGFWGPIAAAAEPDAVRRAQSRIHGRGVVTGLYARRVRRGDGAGDERPARAALHVWRKFVAGGDISWRAGDRPGGPAGKVSRLLRCDLRAGGHDSSRQSAGRSVIIPAAGLGNTAVAADARAAKELLPLGAYPALTASLWKRRRRRSMRSSWSPRPISRSWHAFAERCGRWGALSSRA